MSARPLTVRDATLFFEKAPAALLVIDTTILRIVAANQKAAAFFGAANRSLSGLLLNELLPPAELQRFIEATIASGEPVKGGEGEIANSGARLFSGAVREVDFTFSRLPSGLIVLAIQDSSARGHLEEQLRQSQKMEALGMLAGGIAHDFNNLLTIISGYSQMLQLSNSGGEMDRTALSEVLKACEHAAGLTAQLLAFSRRTPVQPQAIDLNRLIDKTALLLRRLIGEQIDLRIRTEPDAGFVYADPGQIQQVILNLTINARDAMPKGGSLAIRTRSASHGGSTPRSFVLLEVADTGSGMDEETRSRLFEPFFTTKPAGIGTGLGLATVARIVKQFGGTIEVASQAGQGATFRVYLPRVESSADEQKAAQADALGGHETILLVEDDEGVRSMTRHALERRGYTVIAAAGGTEALAAESRYPGAISLLITDMVMPGMNGSDLARQLRERRPAMAVMYVSGYPSDTLDGPAVAGTSFLPKPFTPAALTAAVRDVLDHRKESAAGK
jgi:signal transduction histidine kinase/ActR/RegA family two-component response regulator